jgi:elongation factor Ts
MSVSASLVKELRDVSGAGMMDAKKALTETGGDMEAAIDWLRSKGLSQAAKKSGRVAAEGLVCVKVNSGVGAIIEVNSETDFVAKNSNFQEMVSKISDIAINCETVSDLNKAKINHSTVDEFVADKVAQIGEHISVRRLMKLSGSNMFSYVHNAVLPTMGKIAVLLSLSDDNKELGKQVAMHIAATNPASLSEDDLSPELVEREKIILTEQARESGKPENIIDNMIKGRLKKYFEEVTLLNQKFVINPDITVKQALENSGVEILDFVRLEVGEGIERKEEDFAAEVQKTISG